MAWSDRKKHVQAMDVRAYKDTAVTFEIVMPELPVAILSLTTRRYFCIDGRPLVGKANSPPFYNTLYYDASDSYSPAGFSIASYEIKFYDSGAVLKSTQTASSGSITLDGTWASGNGYAICTVTDNDVPANTSNAVRIDFAVGAC